MSVQLASVIRGWRRWSLATVLTAVFAVASFILVGSAVSVLYWAVVDHFWDEDVDYVADKVHVLRRDLAAASDPEGFVRESIAADASARVYAHVMVRVAPASNGEVIATPGFDALLPDVARMPIEGDASREPLISRVIASDGTPFVLASGAVRLPGGRPGTLRVAYANLQEHELLAHYRRWLIGVLAVATSVCLAVSYVVTRWAIAPLGSIIAATRTVRTSKLDVRIDDSSLPSELVELATSFNAMIDRLRDAFGRMSRFSSDLAHEVRTPINSLMGTLEVAHKRNRSPEEYEEALGSSLEDCRRLTRLVDSLLFVARADDPRTEILREWFDLGGELRSICRFYETLAEDVGIALELRADGNLQMEGDKALIHRAVGNLLENAFQHTPRAGRVSITAQRRDGSVVLSVIDTGSGIAPEHLPHVFDRLYRVDGTGESEGHAGLGLSIVKSVVELHGGQVSIISEIGQGTTVTATLPTGL